MLKQMAVLGAWALLCAGLMAGQPNYAPDNKKEGAKQSQSPVISSNCQNKQADSQADQTESSNNPPAGNASFQWPAWMKDPNWWLVIAAGITGLFICWQSMEMRRAVQIAEKQIALQSIAMRQWVNIEPVGTVTPRTFEGSFEVTLQFVVRNRTDYLLTIKKIATEVFTSGKATIFTVSCDVPILPEKSGAVGGHPFYMSANVSRYTWDTAGHPFIIGGDVTFLDCMKVEQNQTFHGFFHGYADGRLIENKPAGIVLNVADYKPKENQS